MRVAPKTGTVTTVTRLTGQGGHHFNIRTGPGYLKVNRPGLDLRINLTSADHPGGTVQPAIEVAMGANGKLWILVIGFVEISPDLADTVTGLFSVDPAGALSAVARVRNPTSDSDPADGHHLGLRHGGNRPWLTFIDTDALRVYRKK